MADVSTAIVDNGKLSEKNTPYIFSPKSTVVIVM